MTVGVRRAGAAAAVLFAVVFAVLLAGGRPAYAELSAQERSWYLDAINVVAAQSYARGEGVTVAVVDTGVNATQPDLQGQVRGGVEIAADGRVVPDGRSDSDGHGTAMADLIAGSGRDGGIPGVAPGASILPVKIARRSDGSFIAANVYRGVTGAIDHGAKVVSMSLGGPPTPDAPWKHDLVRYAVDHDAVLIAAAGNTHDGQESVPRVAEPASIPGVIAVSAVNRRGQIWQGSATGPEVVIAAPGEQLPYPSAEGYTSASGTSGATALTAGVVALIRSRFPQLHAGDVVNRLIRTAQDRGPKGRDQEYGYGVVDALAALTADLAQIDRYPLPTVAGATVNPRPLVVAVPATRRAAAGLWLLSGTSTAALPLTVLLFRRSRRREQRAVPAVSLVKSAGRRRSQPRRFAARVGRHVPLPRFTQRPLVTVSRDCPARTVEGSASRGRPA